MFQTGRGIHFQCRGALKTGLDLSCVKSNFLLKVDWNVWREFCIFISYLAENEEFTNEMLEAYLELFTVLYLKSDDIVKEVLLNDLY